jgi:porphobilinogen deaminase
MQGFISDIKIDGAKVIISIKDVKMKEEDSLAFGKTLNKDDLIDIFIIDSNKSGPAIKAGDKVMVSCRYTKDNEILYTIGADIRSYEY